uniref:LRAT domain-containing protein n=1 Tax=Rhabditophanes sp. KR3021 TaxID=114890 RepID=A0AC35TJC7_9BILA
MMAIAEAGGRSRQGDLYHFNGHRKKGYVSQWGSPSDLYGKLKYGDCLEFKMKDNFVQRVLNLAHWGIYIGGGRVKSHCRKDREEAATLFNTKIFNSFPASNGKNRGYEIIIEFIEDSAYFESVRVNNKNDLKENWEVCSEKELRRRLRELEVPEYSLLDENCEHFVNRMRFNKNVSGQIDGVKDSGMGFVGAAAIVGTLFAAYKAYDYMKKKDDDDDSDSKE